MATKRDMCLQLLREHEWVTTSDFLRAGCGSRFGGRLHELKALGHDIRSERVRDGEYRYRLQRQDVNPQGAADPPVGDSPPLTAPAGNASTAPGLPSTDCVGVRSGSSYYQLEAELDMAA